MNRPMREEQPIIPEHRCFSGSPGCSGCNPCLPCFERIWDLVVFPMLAPMIASQPQLASQMYRAYSQRWLTFQQQMKDNPAFADQIQVTDVTPLLRSAQVYGARPQVPYGVPNSFEGLQGYPPQGYPQQRSQQHHPSRFQPPQYQAPYGGFDPNSGRDPAYAVQEPTFAGICIDCGRNSELDGLGRCAYGCMPVASQQFQPPYPSQPQQQFQSPYPSQPQQSVGQGGFGMPQGFMPPGFAPSAASFQPFVSPFGPASSQPPQVQQQPQSTLQQEARPDGTINSAVSDARPAVVEERRPAAVREARSAVQDKERARTMTTPSVMMGVDDLMAAGASVEDAEIETLSTAHPTTGPSLGSVMMPDFVPRHVREAQPAEKDESALGNGQVVNGQSKI